MSKGLSQQFLRAIISYFHKQQNSWTVITFKMLQSFLQHLGFMYMLFHYPEWNKYRNIFYTSTNGSSLGIWISAAKYYLKNVTVTETFYLSYLWMQLHKILAWELLIQYFNTAQRTNSVFICVHKNWNLMSMETHFLPMFKMGFTCLTENNFPPTFRLCNSLVLLAIEQINMVCSQHSHSIRGQSHVHISWTFVWRD
jgi:hypothetical protein